MTLKNIAHPLCAIENQYIPSMLSFIISHPPICQCFTSKLSEVYPEEIDCRQGLAEIRMRWCKEHKDLDRFRPPERNTLCPVWLFVLPQRLMTGCICFGGVPACPYIVWGTGLYGKSQSSTTRVPLQRGRIVSLYINYSYCCSSSYNSGKVYSMYYPLFQNILHL